MVKSGQSKTRRIFLGLFRVSTGVLLVVLVPFVLCFMPRLTSGGTGNFVWNTLTIGGLAAAFVSCFASMTTFVGLMATTIMMWRKGDSKSTAWSNSGAKIPFGAENSDAKRMRRLY
jgi:hypothetical protein